MARRRRLFVISDLHLGGRPESRICNALGELVEFVDWIRTQDCDEDRELVVNGDIIDFLAEDDGGTIATDAWTHDDALAVQKLERVVAGVKHDGRGFFDAVSDMLAAGHRVTLMLGNHDVELSLPQVRARLEDILGHGRLRFVYDGEAYTPGKVLIEHGNRYDAWNVIDFDGLREERSVRSRRLPIADEDRRDRYFRAPAGSLLVANFMNPLKRKYRFIDLLKPETGAVLPLLLALEPDLDLGFRALLKAAPIVRQVTGNHHDASGMPVRPGQLGGAGPGAAPLTLDDVLQLELGKDSALFAGAPAGHGTQLGGVRDWLSSLASFAKRLREASAALASLTAIKLASSDDIRRKRLRAALTLTAASDRSFNPGFEIDAYLKAAETLCRDGGFDVVVFGHTHLPKQIVLEPAEGRTATYLNTGTWADVIRIDQLPRPIEDTFIDAVAKNQLCDYTRRFLTFAEIALDGENVREAAIHSFCSKTKPREAPLAPAS